MKLLLTGSAIAILLSLGAGGAGAAGILAPARERIAKPPSSPKGTANAAAAKRSGRKTTAKLSKPSQGYRCSGPSTGDGKSPPTGAVVVERLKLTRLSRPTPTSAVVRLDVTVARHHGKEPLYIYSTTGGRVVGDGPRVTWTVEGVGTYTITLEVSDRGSGCTTFTSATYTIAEPRPAPVKPSGGPGQANGAAAKPQWEIDYQRKLAVYEQELAKQKQAVADYQRQQAEVEARRSELRSRVETTQAQWRAAVAACQAGDYSRCDRGNPQ